MSAEAWLSVATVAAIIVVLALDLAAAEVAMLAGLVVLLLAGAIELEPALTGFAHPAVIMVGSLFVVAAGLTETGAAQRVAHALLGRPRTTTGAQLRLMGPVAVLSAFLNNTPIVAMYLPIVGDWARKIRVSPSKLYLPLSIAAIVGGQTTLIGSASNLVVMGLYLEYASARSGIETVSVVERFWGPAALGLPMMAGAILFVLAFSRWLLPERKPAAAPELDARRYTVRMEVKADSPVVGRSIEAAGLRHLPGLYLSQIDRDEQSIPAPPPVWIIHAGDVLSFAGILESVVDLRKIRGLNAAGGQVEKVSGALDERMLVEAVVSHNSPLVGVSVRASRFRTAYNAAIIAVHRNGEQIKAKVGDIELKAGDTLLLETHGGFVHGYRNSDHFYLVSNVPGSAPVRHEKAWLAMTIFAGVVAALTLTALPPAAIGLAGATAMIIGGCVTASVARGSVNLQVLVVIAAAMGIGQAMSSSGASAAVADQILSAAQALGCGPREMLAVIVLLAAGFAQVVTNNGAAVLMFPIAMAAAAELGVSAEPFMFSLMLGAGSSFLTPIGYQTNLMVYGPGGYRFLDFTRMGVPLTLLAAAIAAVLGPFWFPL